MRGSLTGMPTPKMPKTPRPMLRVVPAQETEASRAESTVVRAMADLRQIARSARALRALLPELRRASPGLRGAAFDRWLGSLLDRAADFDDEVAAQPRAAREG